jgi:hypothetical protein
MNAMFAVVQEAGDGQTKDTSYMPYFSETDPTIAYSGQRIEGFFACNVFDKDQSVLDAIAADPCTEFVIPIEVQGTKLGWKDKDTDLPANLHGKITSWIAKNGLHKLDPDMKKPGQIAKHIMAQVSGVEGVDPLEGFRVHWKE